MKLTKRVREFLLANTRSWEKDREMLGKLTDEEFATAEKLERMGQRRTNKLAALKAERKDRTGRHVKLSRLKIETHL